MPSVTCSDLGFVWPDGTVVLDHVDLALGPGRTGLIGVNGSGKSTLLELIAGRLRPTAGAVQADGTVAYLPQHVTLRTGQGVDDVLGIARQRAALRVLEAAASSDDAATAAALAAIGDDWDVEDRARATLDRLGLGHVDLDRTVGTLSGGEALLLALVGLLLRRPDVLLLDEPTNNLDLDARRRLYEAVAAFRGVLVVVSHDRALLERVDRIAELRDHTVRLYGGNLGAYEQAVALEQQATQRALRAAAATVRRERRELVEAHIKLDRRQRKGRKQSAENRFPKVVAHERKRQAQVSAGKLRGVHADRVATAEAELEVATEAVRDDDEIRIDLPETQVPSRRTVLECTGLNVTLAGTTAGRSAAPRLWGRDVDLAIRGPERIALIGANGSGKTTLLRLIAGELHGSRSHETRSGPATPDRDPGPATGTVIVGVEGVRYLPQRLDLIDDTRSVLENVRLHAPSATVNELRARLARFQFRGARAEQPAGTLSGGERFRATLAALLSAQPPPQLLLLDEPTNNLDLASVQQLERALEAYRGALLVASHDLPFLRRLGLTRWLRLERATGLRDVDAMQPAGSGSP